MKNPDPDLDLARAFAGEVNNFMLGHLKHYQKLLKKGKLNARQRTEKFGRGSLVQYVLPLFPYPFPSPLSSICFSVLVWNLHPLLPLRLSCAHWFSYWLMAEDSYNESLVTDEKGLLVFFKQLKELFEQVATRKRLSERRLEEDADVKIEPGTGSENIRTFGCESDGLNVSASRAGERGRKRRRGAEGERVGHVVGDLTEKKRKLDDKRKARCK